MVFFSRSGGRPFLAFTLLLLSLSAAGCSAGKGELSGKVSYKGKPLVYGSVLLIGSDSKPRTTWIQTDGTYRFEDVPAGQAKLAVYSPDPAKQTAPRKRGQTGKPAVRQLPAVDRPTARQLPAVDRTKWFAIPDTYSEVNHSGLSVTIVCGPNAYDIEMK
jgi:hypothetical protein